MARIKNLPTHTVKPIKFEKIFLCFLPCRGIQAYTRSTNNSPFNFFLSVHCVLPFFQPNVSFPFIASFLSFCLFLSMRYFCPFVPYLIFRSLLLPIRFNSSRRFNSTLHFRSLRLSFRFTFSLLCVTSVRSFQVLYHPVRFFFPFVSTLPCRLLRPSF